MASTRPGRPQKTMVYPTGIFEAKRLRGLRIGCGMWGNYWKMRKEAII